MDPNRAAPGQSVVTPDDGIVAGEWSAEQQRERELRDLVDRQRTLNGATVAALGRLEARVDELLDTIAELEAKLPQTQSSGKARG